MEHIESLSVDAKESRLHIERLLYQPLTAEDTPELNPLIAHCSEAVQSGFRQLWAPIELRRVISAMDELDRSALQAESLSKLSALCNQYEETDDRDCLRAIYCQTSLLHCIVTAAQAELAARAMLQSLSK